MHTPPVGSGSTYQPNYSRLNFDLDEMLRRATVFSKRDEQLLNYIKGILTNSDFQSDPQAYLNAWEEQRGTSEISFHPEDTAREFFDRHFEIRANGWCNFL